MHRASIPTGWVRNPVMISPELDPGQASSYELGWISNPLTGCRNHTNGLCKGGNFPCYAYKLANGRLKSRYLANRNTAPPMPNVLLPNLGFVEMNPFYPRLWPERLEQPFEIKGSAGIFPCDMSDLFGIGIPHEWTEVVMNIIKIADRHRFYLLTKQPQNLIKFSPFPDHCYVGVTITNDKMRYDALYWLKQIQAKVKYLSIEPFLGRIQIAPIDLQDAGIKWVIIGAQTKPYKPPKIEWVEEIVRACDKAGIPVFLKDNLHSLLIPTYITSDSRLFWRFDIELKQAVLRQEMPE